MLARILAALMLGVAVSQAAWAEEPTGDSLLVLGEAGHDVSEPDAVPVEQNAAAELPPVDGAVIDDPTTPVIGSACETKAFGDSCVDEEPAWVGFTSVDALFIQRTNLVGPLAVRSEAALDRGVPVITAGDVRYPTTPGLRIFQGWRRSDCTGIEVGYIGIWNMHADALAVSPDALLALPGQLGVVGGSGFDAATAIAPTLSSTLNSAECNVFATRIYDGCQRHDPLPWRRSWGVLAETVATADWLLGIRWAGLDETATLAVTADSANTTSYRTTTSSQLIGPQIGHRRRVDWGDWSVEGWAKAGLMASTLTQSQSAIVGPQDLVQVRAPFSSTRIGLGMIGDLNASVVRRIGDRWGIRAGYTLLWLADVAPAANQWDFSDTPTSGTQLRTGSVFLHGATLGLEAAW